MSLTTAQQRNLRRLAKRCVQTGDYGPLVAFVNAYDARPREPLKMPGNAISSPVAGRADDPATLHAKTPPSAPTAADVWRPLGWWERFWRDGWLR